MPRLTYRGQRYECAPGETVLEALVRGGVEVPSSCRAGCCQTCLLRSLSGPPPAASQRALGPGLVEYDHFLACLCRPEADMEVAPPGAALRTVSAVLTERRRLSSDVVALRLSCLEPFPFRAGQFIHLQRDDGLVRSFSIASRPEDGVLELHVKRVRGGRMSEWIHDELAAGARVQVRGPAGECFYQDDDREAPLLLVGTGTGIAPLRGIAKDALARKHGASITLIHVAARPEGLYLHDELSALSQAHENVRYQPCVKSGAGSQQELARQVVFEQLSRIERPARTRAFLCGNPEVVTSLRKQLFLAGLSLGRISADAFLLAPPPAAEPAP